MKRTATAVVLLPLAYVSIQYFSRFWFFFIVQIIILAALIEFYNLPRKKRIYPQRALGVMIALLLAASFYVDAFSIETALFLSVLMLGVYFLLQIKILEKLIRFPSSAALTLFGAVYLSFLLNHFLWLRDEHGPLYVFYMMVVIFVGDTGAMLVGRRWGKRKILPLASPKKTWEGAVAGLITGALAGFAFQQLFLKGSASPEKAVIFALAIQVVAQISDPLESLFKRASGVKDSSNLLPGHGGFLDRVDSLILNAPFFYYLLEYVGMQ